MEFTGTVRQKVAVPVKVPFVAGDGLGDGVVGVEIVPFGFEVAVNLVAEVAGFGGQVLAELFGPGVEHFGDIFGQVVAIGGGEFGVDGFRVDVAVVDVTGDAEDNFMGEVHDGGEAVEAAVDFGDGRGFGDADGDGSRGLPATTGGVRWSVPELPDRPLLASIFRNIAAPVQGMESEREVEKMIAEKMRQRFEEEERRHQAAHEEIQALRKEYDTLAQSIATFSSVSGIHLDHWRANEDEFHRNAEIYREFKERQKKPFVKELLDAKERFEGLARYIERTIAAAGVAPAPAGTESPIAG